jgi:hypothetical protein
METKADFSWGAIEAGVCGWVVNLLTKKKVNKTARAGLFAFIIQTLAAPGAGEKTAFYFFDFGQDFS